MSTEHPAPWRWEGDSGDEGYLEDGAGDMILHPSNDSGISLASPRVRVLIACAPEMEALLRDRVRWYGGVPDASWLIDRNAILARLDAAKDGT